MSKVICMILFVFSSLITKGQNGLTPGQIESMKTESEQIIRCFQSNLRAIVHKDPNDPNDLKTRKTACELCKALFYAKGGYYTTADGKRDACTIEIISSFRNQSKSTDLVASYLDRMATTRLNLVIDSCNTVRIDNPYKLPDGRYACTAHFYQAYIKYSNDGNKILYADETHKTAVLLIEVSQLPDGVIEFYIKMEDIKANECNPYSGYRR